MIPGKQTHFTGDWRARDVSTMLKLESPYLNFMEKIRGDKIVKPQNFLDTLEPFLGNTQRPIEGYNPSSDMIVRSSLNFNDSGDYVLNISIKSLFGKIADFRSILIPVSTLLYGTIHSDISKDPRLTKIKCTTDVDLLNLVVDNMKEVDRSMRRIEIFKCWLNMEKQRGPFWRDLTKDLNDKQKSILVSESAKWLGY